MSTLNRLHGKHGHLRWLFVYTLEAHAVDEWPISSSRYNPSGEVVSIRQPKTLQDRIEAATQFQQAFLVDFPLRVDGIENPFEEVFCTWPFRFYIVRDGRVAFQARPQGDTLPLEPFIKALDAL